MSAISATRVETRISSGVMFTLSMYSTSEARSVEPTASTVIEMRTPGGALSITMSFGAFLPPDSSRAR